MKLNWNSTGLQVLALAAFVTLTGGFPATGTEDSMGLTGTWRLRLDRENQGLAENWGAHPLEGAERVILPGSLPAQGIGDDVSLATPWVGGIQDPNWTNNPIYKPYTTPGNFKFPFWLQPEKYYAGAAWYQREVTIPESWTNQRVVLRLERPHWETQVWLDGRAVGTNRSLSTPHLHDLGMGLAPGTHLLTLRVDNRLVVDVGINSHCMTDHTQGDWNGVVGRIALEATAPVWIEDLQVFPDSDNERVLIRGLLGNAGGEPGKGNLSLRVTELAGNGPVPAADEEVFLTRWDKDGGSFERAIRIKKLKTWDEFNPRRYSVAAALENQPPAKAVTFGFRKLATESTQFVLNGRETFFRGTLECCIFPKTGHPPTDVDSWKRIIGIAKAHGLNMIRFHSYCPPEAAFDAADELGFYYQVETCWPNGSTTLGDDKPVDDWVYAETDRILKHYGNHPSFLLMTHGNEPGGRNANAYLAKYVSYYKIRDPRRLWTAGSGWPQLAENDYHVTPDPRIQAWGGGLHSRINARAPETRTDYRDYIQQRRVPVISHEIGQWCVYPNFEEMPKYTGYLKPRNFEIFRDSLRANGMGDQAKDFLLASGKLQTLCYKEDIESALRTPGMGGFQLLDLHDFPGQGTALVGVLDPFWDSKGYVTPEEFRRFCNSTVPLARMTKRVFTQEESCRVELEAAHFGAEPFKNPTLRWSVLDLNGKAVASGEPQVGEIPFGSGLQLGAAEVDLSRLPAPARYKFVFSIAPSGAKSAAAFENDWDFWVYPSAVSTAPGEVLIARELSEAALQKLAGGGKVLLTLSPDQVAPGKNGRVTLGFSSIFWNTAWTGGQPPHTLGVLCDPKHPAFVNFPTEYHSNWQWWYLISRAGAMVLGDLPQGLRPVVQVVDDWFTNRKLGLAFEAQAGGGKLLVTSIDLAGEMNGNPVARQFLASLLSYMNSPRFAPAEALPLERVRALFSERTALQKLGGRIIRASSAQPGYEPENAIDGDPRTFWHSRFQETPAEFPHEIAIAFDTVTEIKGLNITQRGDGNRNGWIGKFEIYAGADWRQWGKPVYEGELKATTDEQAIEFTRPVKAQFLRIVALSGHNGGPWAAIAEVDVLK